MSCVSLDAAANASLADTLVGLDCQVNGLVSLGYGRLFGHGGALGAALTGLLTIYVLLIGYTLITGRMRISLPAMTPKVATLAFVLTFATAWPAYQALVYGLLTGGPDQIAAIFMGAKSGATAAFAHRLDQLFNAMVEMGQAVSSAGDPNAEAVKTASKLAWSSAITVLLSTVGLLVISRIVLAVLLAIGPIFIVLALFKSTRGLFEGWLRTSVAFAFTPMLVVLGGSGLIAVIEPMIQPIVDDPAAAVANPRGLIALFVTAVVYAVLLPTLGFTGVSLTRGWRATKADVAPTSVDIPVSGAGDMSAVAQASAAAETDRGRIGMVVAAVSRDGSSQAGEVSLASHRLDIANDVASRPILGAASRSVGLGQSFRSVDPAKPLTAKVQS